LASNGGETRAYPLALRHGRGEAPHMMSAKWDIREMVQKVGQSVRRTRQDNTNPPREQQL
jgi:hypothetical protein